MSVGGNGRARQFFKQHGWSELGSDKIEQKVCSEIHAGQETVSFVCGNIGVHAQESSAAVCPAQYTSRAAQLYRQQLEKDATKLSVLPKPEAVGDAPPAAAAPLQPPPEPVSEPAPAAGLAFPNGGAAAPPAENGSLAAAAEAPPAPAAGAHLAASSVILNHINVRVMRALPRKNTRFPSVSRASSEYGVTAVLDTELQPNHELLVNAFGLCTMLTCTCVTLSRRAEAGAGAAAFWGGQEASRQSGRRPGRQENDRQGGRQPLRAGPCRDPSNPHRRRHPCRPVLLALGAAPPSVQGHSCHTHHGLLSHKDFCAFPSRGTKVRPLLRQYLQPMSHGLAPRLALLRA